MGKGFLKLGGQRESGIEIRHDLIHSTGYEGVYPKTPLPGCEEGFTSKQKKKKRTLLAVTKSLDEDLKGRPS